MLSRIGPRPSRAAAIWSLAYGAVGLFWTLGGEGYPFGPQNDPGAAISALGGVSEMVGAAAIATLGVGGAIVAAGMAWRIGRGGTRRMLLVFAWALAATLLLIVPDYRVLVAVAYAPLFLVGAPFGWPPDANYFDVFTWPVVNQLLFIGGGLLWAATAFRYGRETSEASCVACGRSDTSAGWTSASAAARWGRGATAVAVAVPLAYALTRWAWAFGIPLGITDEFLRQGQETGVWLAGAGLATVAAAGAGLTLGLAMRWGEVFPGWIPLLGGRVVPVGLAVVPAGIVAILVTSAGLMFVRLAVTGSFGDAFASLGPLEDNWAALVPELLWPVWGVALGAAALAYHHRRRGRHAIRA